MSGSAFEILGIDPCPGDPDVVAALARRWRNVALALTAVAVRLDSTNDAQARWKGKAANTFRDTLNGQRATISNLCASCTDNAEVLSEWAAHLRDLQLEARRLERGAAAAGLQSWAGAGRSAVQGAQSAAGVSGGHDPDLLGGFASGFVHSVENLHERYLEASRDFAHRVAALLDLPTGTKGRYGSGTGVLAGQLLVTAAPLVSAGISGDSGLRELSIPIDNDQPYELTGEPWPPSTTTPDGVFQKNEQDDYDSSILGWIFTEENDMDEASAALIGMYALGLPHAAHWFNHYLNGSGSDLNFDAAQPYKDDPRFRSLVNGTIRTKITESPGEPDFDSGYLYHAAPFSTDDWHNAIGGSFYRTTGHRNPDGSWIVKLRITSYYQFRDGVNFPPVQGSDMRDLERDGIAKNFREIGTATLIYDRNGNFVRAQD